MPLIEPETKYSLRFLLLAGIPAFFLAVIISLCIHQYVHITVQKYSCRNEAAEVHHDAGILDYTENESGCPPAAFAGILSSFILALVSFALFINRPRNIFLASMAFVNASGRVPGSFIVFFQLLFKGEATHITDESLALQLLHFKDPTAFVVILCFYTLTILFLSITVIHDIKIIRHKWIVATALFVTLVPLENLLWKALSPLIPAA